jgi:hypothetical protein
MTRKKPTGRPKLPPGAGKETKLQVRLLRSEEEEIEAAADKAGKTKSQFVRDTLLEAVRGKAQKRPKKKGAGSLLTEIGTEPAERQERHEPPQPQQPLISEESGQEFLD